MRTLRREIRKILERHFPGENQEVINACADEILKLRALNANVMQNAGIDWLVAAGASVDEINETLERECQEETIAALYEKAMGYNPLPWHSERDLEKLLRFLVTKSPDEIKRFAAWSRRPYSTFDPAKARQYPLRVIDFWPLAQEAQVAEQSGQRRDYTQALQVLKSWAEGENGQ
jgi:hypothetical protein